VNITLKQLSVFTTTARLDGISKAATELCMTQSAASQSLKELESILGATLFNRFGRRLILNEHGRELLDKANQMLTLQATIQQGQTNTLQGILNVAASVTIGSYVMPKLLANFVQQHPLVEPKLLISNSDSVIDRLMAGQAHIGLIEAPINHQQLLISPWRDDQLAIFCSPENNLAKQTDLSLKQIPKQRWILREHGSGTRSVFIAAMQQQGLMVSQSMDLARQEAIKQAVKANLGIGVLSHLSISQEIELGLFKLLKTPLNLNRKFSIVQSKHYANSQLVDAFHEFLVNSEKAAT